MTEPMDNTEAKYIADGLSVGARAFMQSGESVCDNPLVCVELKIAGLVRWEKFGTKARLNRRGVHVRNTLLTD